jgi:IQ calmodulin-binding motif
MASTLPSPQGSQVLVPPPVAEAGGSLPVSSEPVPADSFAFVFSESEERRKFIAGLDAALRDALLNFDHECGAAIRIQAATRGFLTRLRIAELHYYATEIQRLARGHLARRIARQRLEHRARDSLQAFKSGCARSIQRIYRGFRSRKYLHDYYARKRYVAFVAAKGEEIRQASQAALEEQLQVSHTEDWPKGRCKWWRPIVFMHCLSFIHLHAADPCKRERALAATVREAHAVFAPSYFHQKHFRRLQASLRLS